MALLTDIKIEQARGAIMPNVEPQGSPAMTGHMPPIPKGNQSSKGPKAADAEAVRDTSVKESHTQNTNEQGDSANIRQNTTNKGFFHGRRVK
jgi:hypothetical protein